MSDKKALAPGDGMFEVPGNRLAELGEAERERDRLREALDNLAPLIDESYQAALTLFNTPYNEQPDTRKRLLHATFEASNVAYYARHAASEAGDEIGPAPAKFTAAQTIRCGEAVAVLDLSEPPNDMNVGTCPPSPPIRAIPTDCTCGAVSFGCAPCPHHPPTSVPEHDA